MQKICKLCVLKNDYAVRISFYDDEIQARKQSEDDTIKDDLYGRVSTATFRGTPCIR